MDQSKTCTKCGEPKPTTDFGRDKNRRDGMNPWCKPCNRANARRYGEANRETINAKQAARYAANPEDYRARVRAYARRNQDIVRARSASYYQAHAAERRAYAAEYYRRDPQLCIAVSERAKAKRPDYYRMTAAAGSAARRARLREVPQVPFTAEQLGQRMAYFGHRCWMCGADATTVDHVKPIFAGGPNMLANLRPACRPCNSGKAGRWPYIPKNRIIA